MSEPTGSRTQPVFQNTNYLPGGSVIYYEVIRDVARQLHLGASDLERDTVLHELGHALIGGEIHPVTGADKEVAEAFAANRAVDLAVLQAGMSKYVPFYLAQIRDITKPLS